MRTSFIFLYYFECFGTCFMASTFFVYLSSLSFLSAPSLRLVYKDLEQQRKIEEQKLKGLDGKKKEQAERLGMGLGIRGYDDDAEETSHPVADLRISLHISRFFCICFSAVEFLTL